MGEKEFFMNTPVQVNRKTLQREFLSKFSIWMVASVLTLATLITIQAKSADVFIDEGEGDYDTTPVGNPAAGALPSTSTPAADVTATKERTPAQTELADPTVVQDGSSPSPGTDLGSPSADPMPTTASPSIDPIIDPASDPMNKPVEPVKAKKSKKKESTAAHSKKSKKKVAKKAAKKSKKKIAKKDKKTKSAKSDSNKKRKVASVGSFAGGSYKTTKDECKLQTKPGAKTFIGETVPSRKLWVEKSSNPNYYKVHGKDGSPAYVKKNCFN